MQTIKIQNLKKYYGASRGIEDVSFDLNQGEILGFVGPNGAGKSTTIKILMGLVVKTSGVALINGLDCYANYQVRQDIGYISSDSTFYKNLLAKDIFKLTADAYGRGYDKYSQLAERLQLDLSKQVGQLSMGNRKKVGIINSLITGPKLLILDEPTNGLDPLIQKEFFALINEARNNGATIMLSTHILSDVQNYCDRAVIIKGGKIVANSSIQDLLKTKLKEISIVFTGSVPTHATDFATKYNLNITNNILSGDYKGDLSELFNLVSKTNVLDCNIANSDLDKIIFNYYQ